MVFKMDPANEEFVDKAFASDGGICITVFACLLFCCFCMGFCRKTMDDEDDSTDWEPPSAKGCCLWMFQFLRHTSVLIEDWTFLYYADADKFGESSIFWTIFIFAMSGGILMMCCCWLPKPFQIASQFIIELVQYIVFSYQCSWSGRSLGVFGGLMAFQAFCTVVELAAEVMSDDADDDEKVMNGMQVCLMAFQIIMGGVGTIPYIYFNANSPFRQRYFDAILTFSMWLGGVVVELNFGQMMGLMNVETDQGDDEDGIGTFESWFFMFSMVVQKAIQYFMFIVAAYYYDIGAWKRENNPGVNIRSGFEKGWLIFIIVSMSCDMCSTCCQAIKYMTGGGEEDGETNPADIFGLKRMQSQLQMANA